MDLTKKAKLARIPANLLVFLGLFEFFFWMFMFIMSNAYYLFLPNTFSRGLTNLIGLVMILAAMGLRVGTPFLLRSKRENGVVQAARVNLVSFVLTVLGLALNYNTLYILFYYLFEDFGREVFFSGTAFVCMLVLVCYIVIFVLLLPFLKQKSALKGTKRYIVLALVTVVIGSMIAVLPTAFMKMAADSAIEELDAFHEFTATDVVTGETVTEDVLKGKVTILNIWETTCGPCKGEMPYMQEVSQAYLDTNVQFIGLCFDSQSSSRVQNPASPEEVLAILSEAGVTYLNIVPSSELVEAIIPCLEAFPTTFVLDEEGNILDTRVGGMDAEAWTQFVEQYVK